MEADVYEIEEKTKTCDIGVSSIADFRVRRSGQVDAQVLLDDPHITPYCLDDTRREAVFVESAPDSDPTAKPFFFLAQYQAALRLFTIPFETLNRLGDSAGDRFHTFIPMYSVGRCGGTLLSRVMNRAGSVLSLDEPDVYNNLVEMRPRDGSRDAEIEALVRSCTRLLFKPPKPHVNTLFIKFRPQSIEIGDLLYRAFPSARTMFLYRNADTWARSAARSVQATLEAAASHPRAASRPDPAVQFFSMVNIDKNLSPSLHQPHEKHHGAHTNVEALSRSTPLLPPYIRRVLREQLTGREKLAVLCLLAAQRVPLLRNLAPTPADYLAPQVGTIPPMKLLTLVWLSAMHRYLKLHSMGIPMLAVRYETLVSSPGAALQAIFEYCGLPAATIPPATEVFWEDSQKDTPLSREKVGTSRRGNLDPELLMQLREVLREHPPVTTPDFIAPGTLDLQAGSAFTH
jgi:hypothetical protein